MPIDSMDVMDALIYHHRTVIKTGVERVGLPQPTNPIYYLPCLPPVLSTATRTLRVTYQVTKCIEVAYNV